MTPRFVICTLGCKVNQYESQAIAEQLEANGWTQTKLNQPCDFVILNTCAVTAESVRKAKQLARRASKLHPDSKILIAGCASQLDKDAFASLPSVTYVCGTRNKNTIVTQALLLSKATEMKREATVSTLVLPPEGEIEPMQITRFDRTRAYVKIQDGCNGKCTYCIIPSLRGKSCSRPVQDVIDEVQWLVDGGCKEIVLTGIETSAYQYDLASLLEKIDSLAGLERIRLGSLDPSFMKPQFVDRIASLRKLVPHFHLSLQSGSDSVLMRMKRRYLTKTVRENVAYLKKMIPPVLFSTDIIVGFPGETEEDFEQSVRMAEEIGFLHIHVFPYSPRPGTIAAQLPGQIPDAVKAQRVARLSEIGEMSCERILETAVQEKRLLSVLVESEKDHRIYIGHSAEFIEVHFTSDIPLTRGELVSVCPKKTEDGYIFGVSKSKPSNT